jgi:hypothetical protein
VLRRYRKVTAAGVLFALTLPGLAVLVVVVAALEHAWSRQGVPSHPPNRRIDLDRVAYLGCR